MWWKSATDRWYCNRGKEENHMIQTYIARLTEYGLKTGLIEPADKIYTLNRLLELFELDAPEDDMGVENGSGQTVPPKRSLSRSRKMSWR